MGMENKTMHSYFDRIMTNCSEVGSQDSQRWSIRTFELTETTITRADEWVLCRLMDTFTVSRPASITIVAASINTIDFTTSDNIWDQCNGAEYCTRIGETHVQLPLIHEIGWVTLGHLLSKLTHPIGLFGSYKEEDGSHVCHLELFTEKQHRINIVEG